MNVVFQNNISIRFAICGGGGLGHNCAGVLSSIKGVKVDMLTNRPEKWNQRFRVNTPDDGCIIGKLDSISSDPKDIIPNADIVFLCLPAFLVEKTILKIKPYLKPGAIVGSVFGCTGFFIYAHKHLQKDTKLFAFQRVPYVSRVVEYGKESNLLGYRDKLIMAIENIDQSHQFQHLIEELFKERVELCDSFYEVTLSNSNPILHTGRLFTMWHDWDGKPFDKCSLFYNEWTIETSQLEIEMDREFFNLLDSLKIKTTFIETLLEHYESTDALSMTAKIKSIKPLSTILSPMKKLDNGWVPDFSSRYFTEDFPYGLKFIHDLAHEKNILCPKIDMVYNWGMSMICDSE